MATLQAWIDAVAEWKAHSEAREAQFSEVAEMLGKKIKKLQQERNERESILVNEIKQLRAEVSRLKRE